MESNSYVLYICILLGIFCVQTPLSILSLVIHFKNWYKAMNNVIAPLSFFMLFIAYAMVVVFNNYFGKQISEIPFGWQIAIICVIGLIDFAEFVIVMFVSEGYPFMHEKSSGGGIDPYFGKE